MELTNNGAALVSLPAYTIQGAYMSFRNRFAKSVDNYIAASRVIQGGEEYDAATPEERADVVARWHNVKFDLKGFYALKLKEAKDGKEASRSPALLPPTDDRFQPESPQPRSDNAPHYGIAPLLTQKGGSGSVGHFGPLGRHALRGRDSWKRNHIDVKLQPQEHDEEFEQAIQSSVQQTSRGDAAEDARVERAIRQSVMSLQGGHGAAQPAVPELAGSVPKPEVDLQITDEEYQALIERAIQQSMADDAMGATTGSAPQDDEELKRAIERSRAEAAAPEEERDEELRRALEESRAVPGPADEEEELRRAIEASEREGREEAARAKEARTEEDIVMEYVMKQSLREEEYRKAMREGGQGSLAGARKVEESEEGEGGKGKERETDSDEEELRRAVEMSLRVEDEYGGIGAGPSTKE